uniref:(northern house mosquito) hypothetical protein n=2 Tax=Culex pipiens TaxID=7175 RepID=A0A8D8DKD6_CULPI
MLDDWLRNIRRFFVLPPTLFNHAPFELVQCELFHVLELFRFARKYLQPLVDFAAQSRRRTVSFALDLATDRLAQIVQLDRLLPAGHDAGVRLLQRREDRHDAVLVDGQRTLHHRELLPQEGHLVLEVVLLLALVLGVLDGADQLLQFLPEAFAMILIACLRQLQHPVPIVLLDPGQPPQRFPQRRQIRIVLLPAHHPRRTLLPYLLFNSLTWCIFGFFFFLRLWWHRCPHRGLRHRVVDQHPLDQGVGLFGGWWNWFVNCHDVASFAVYGYYDFVIRVRNDVVDDGFGECGRRRYQSGDRDGGGVLDDESLLALFFELGHSGEESFVLELGRFREVTDGRGCDWRGGGGDGGWRRYGLSGRRRSWTWG